MNTLKSDRQPKKVPYTPFYANRGELPIVYLGPSLPRSEAEQIIAADYRPPIRRGDLPAHYHGVIVIIDGEFWQSLSVSPKEILRLLDQGTRIIGASSMGALRAAELYPYGMEGCGWIFEAYRTGRILGDDEVALIYSPQDMHPLTVPLVNIRYWLKCLKDAEQISQSTAKRLFNIARQMFFADRSLNRLREKWEEAVGPITLNKLLMASGGEITNIKAADARMVLSFLSSQLVTVSCNDFGTTGDLGSQFFNTLTITQNKKKEVNYGEK